MGPYTMQLFVSGFFHLRPRLSSNLMASSLFCKRISFFTLSGPLHWLLPMPRCSPQPLPFAHLLLHTLCVLAEMSLLREMPPLRPSPRHPVVLVTLTICTTHLPKYISLTQARIRVRQVRHSPGVQNFRGTESPSFPFDSDSNVVWHSTIADPVLM